jgi:hypothetical protein
VSPARGPRDILDASWRAALFIITTLLLARPGTSNGIAT